VSEANLAIVRRIYAEIVERPEEVRNLLAPDFEMDNTDTAPEAGVVRGFDAMVEVLVPYFESFDEFRVSIEEVLHDDPQHLIVTALDEGRMRGSAAEIRNQRFHVWTFRDGRIVRFTTHLDRDQAFRAVGLSP